MQSCFVERRIVGRVIASSLPWRRSPTCAPIVVVGAPAWTTHRTATWSTRINLASFLSQSSLGARSFSSFTSPPPPPPPPSATATTASLRNLAKPFLLRAHPDVQTVPDAKQINLEAIQNLNSYLDSMEHLISSSKTSRQQPRMSDYEQTVEIDFVIMVEEQQQAKKRHKGVLQTSVSRRKVQLAWPSRALLQERFSTSAKALLKHAQQEMAKLLRVAGLPVPVGLDVASSLDDDDAADESLDDETEMWADVLDIDKEHGRMEMWKRYYNGGKRSNATTPFFARQEAARRRFTRTIDWKKFDAMYKKAWREAQADVATQGVIRNSRERRMQFIAQILSRCVPDDDVSVVERFCAMRRLSLFLEQNFDKLELEDCSAMWEQITIRLKGARPYNTSSSAMHKRRKEQAENGYAFALDAKHKVSAEIPLDFREDELLQEWERNLWDFYDVMGDSFDDIFIQPQSASS